MFVKTMGGKATAITLCTCVVLMSYMGLGIHKNGKAKEFSELPISVGRFGDICHVFTHIHA
jgi:hypothetical protein